VHNLSPSLSTLSYSDTTLSGFNGLSRMLDVDAEEHTLAFMFDYGYTNQYMGDIKVRCGVVHSKPVDQTYSEIFKIFRTAKTTQMSLAITYRNGRLEIINENVIIDASSYFCYQGWFVF
jgi:hypothetical protein